MKTILVTTDFSTGSDNAVDYAADLATHAHSRLILFHCFAVPVPVYEGQTAVIPFEELEKQNQKMMISLEKKLKSSHTDLEVKTLVKSGFVAEEIMEAGNTTKAEVIVMGVKETSGTPAILGSNIASVIKNARQPVLTVPAEVKFRNPATIAMACDYKTFVPDEAINNIKKFLHLFKSKLLLFNVLKKSEQVSYLKAEAQVNLENSLVGIKHSVFFPQGEDLVKEINEFIKNNNVDMLIVMPHHYDFLRGLFHRSSTNKIIHQTHLPIISLQV